LLHQNFNTIFHVAILDAAFQSYLTAFYLYGYIAGIHMRIIA